MLPFTPLASVLGFAPLPATFLLFLVAVVGSYLVVVELVKGRVMHRTAVPSNRPARRSSSARFASSSG
jgi:hypothetical protein